MAKLQDMIKMKLDRDYEILDPGVALTVGMQTDSVKRFAEMYRPIFYVDPRLGDMRPDALLYEALSPGTRLIFNYYLQWHDEVHPNTAWHYIYRGFRSVVYGSPRDIEYVQVRVSFRTGEVVAVAFERDPSGRHDHPAPAHDVVICARGADEEMFKISVNGAPGGSMALPFDGKRVRLLVATWNHIYDFYDDSGDHIADPPLVLLDNELFKKYYLARRSRPPEP